jgi:hypothetical protein
MSGKSLSALMQRIRPFRGKRARFRKKRWGASAEQLEARSLLTTLSVTTRFDVMDPNDGVLSLREALAAAADETENPGHDTIEFDLNLGSGMIHADYGGFTVETDSQTGKDILKEWFAPNSGGQFVVDSDVTIDGSALGLVRIGHERGWAERHRIFKVNTGVTATFERVVVQGGDSNDGDGGGIWNAGELTLQDGVVGSNYALTTGFGTRGGGIFNASTGKLTLQNTHVGEVALTSGFLDDLGFSGDFYAAEEVSERTRFTTFVYRGEAVVAKSTSDATQISGNGSYGNGGGIYNDGELYVTQGSVIRGNRAHDGTRGGGVFNAGTMVVQDSRIEDQTRFGGELQSSPTGAGIYNTGNLQIERSTFRNNVTNRQGGAIYNTGVLSVVDTVFEDNSASKNANQTGLPDPEGGAIYDAGTSTYINRSSLTGGTAGKGGAVFNASNGELTLNQVTIADNSATTGGGGVYVSGGVVSVLHSTIAWNTSIGQGGGIYNAGTAILRNSIVAENTAADSSSGPDIFNANAITSRGHNLVDQLTGSAFANGTQATDLVGVSALLGPAGDLGGTTRTVGLLPSSPAIDSGAGADVARHDYRLQGSLVDENDGLALASQGGTVTPSGYVFAAGQGIGFTTDDLVSDQYSIEMSFRIDSLTPVYKKLIDFKDRASDEGIYIWGGRLQFFNETSSATDVISANTQHHLVLTRNRNTKEVVAWVDGVEVFRFQDVGGKAVFDAAGGSLQFFRDDNVTGDVESVGGTLNRLRFYDQLLTPEQIGELALDMAALDSRSIEDQRLMPGIVGRRMDRGAFESVPPTTMRVDTLDDINDGLYGDGQLSLREAVEWAHQLPGPDEIAFDPDLVGSLADDPGTIALALGQLTITDDLAIYGPGSDRLAISGQGLSRIFHVLPTATVELSGMKLTSALGVDRGGAVLNEGDLTVRELHVTGNQVIKGSENRGYGGGIANYGAIVIDSTTIDNNTAVANGGGLYTWGTASIVNSTLSANTASFGGGMHAAFGSVTVESTTITANDATTKGGGFRRFPNATMVVSNSIIARNSSPSGPDGNSEITGSLTGSYNLIGIADESGFTNGVNNNQVGTSAAPIDPLLGSLRNLGGTTPVHGLLPGSPALEFANPANFPRYDQRGVPRPVDVLPDIGAFEYVAPTLTNPIVVDSLNGDSDGAFGPGEMSLTEAILFTNADAAYTSIDFASGLLPEDGSPAIMQLLNTELDVTSGVVVNGPGADKLEIRGAGDGFGVFDVHSNAVLRVRNLKISGGDVRSGNQGRVFGGGVNNYGYTTLDGVYLTDNVAQYGGAVHNSRFATLVVSNSTIANSQAFWGGGLLNNGNGTLTNVTVSGNSTLPQSFSAGGGIYSEDSRPDLTGSSLTLIHTTITNNTGRVGGGIFNDGDADLSLGNTIIAGNTTETSAADFASAATGVTSLGGNIVGIDDGLLAPMGGTDQIGTTSVPLLVPMTDLVVIGDAAMPMHGLLPEPGGNPAVNKGLVANGVGSDQRGVSRPFDGGYDVGAFELGAVDSLAFTFDNEIVVDNLSDVPDAYYGPGGMSLREAVMLTNSFNATNPIIIDGVAYDRIRFDESLFDAASESPVLIDLIHGGLLFHGNVIIETTAASQQSSEVPPRVLLDGNQDDHVLEMLPGVSARLSDLVITGGRADGQRSKDKQGAGIYTAGDLWLTRVDVINNAANSDGGGIHAGAGDVWLKDVMVSGNSATYGGGISVQGGNDLTMLRSSVFDNSATETGGGIVNIGATTIRASAIYDNTAKLGGGFASWSGNGIVENTTISGNTATFGGGVYRGFGGTLRFVNSTISDNTATTHAGGVRSPGSIEFANTILAGNHSATGPDALNNGAFTSLGYNIFGSTSQFTNGSGTFTTGPGDLLNTDPLLGPLGDNGGPTLTHPISPTSPAIDAGGAAFTSLMDQRGFSITDIPGVGNDVSDIGAYEIQSVSSSPWDYAALGKSQFGPGDALIYGFGFDDGKANSSVRSDPYFLGFEFDTGPLKFGKIEDGPFGTKFGGEVKADFSGKLGFDVGFYVNSGSVDVTYFGDVNYVVDPGTDGSSVVSAYIDVNDGSLYTVSPKIGAYADLVVELDADVSAQAALFGVVGADLIDVHVKNKTELFSLNRQMNDRGRPLFLTDTGEAVARDSKTGKWYDLAVVPQQIPDPGLIIPLLDGDIRYFELNIEEVAKGVIKAAKAARELVKDVKAVRELNSANRDVANSENEIDQQNKRLEKAETEGRRNTSLKAQQEMTDLAGPEYATAVAQGKKGDELPEKKGKIRDANDNLVSAKKNQKSARDKVKKRVAKKLKSVSAGVVIDVGRASGSLLGAEVNIGVGVSLGLASVTKNIGSVQVTLPDVNLRDSAPNSLGLLTATTSDFLKNSEDDLKRQIAKAQVDLGAFIPGFPGGTYNVSLGPISLDITTVSYNVGPQLNVTQDVGALPVKVDQGLTYEFFRDDGTTPETVQVLINGTPFANGAAVHTVTFNEGDRLEVIGNDRDADDQPDPVVVMPTLTIGSRFSNDIGLDMDLDGAFKAFGLSLSAFGVDLVDIGPLLKHNHTLHTFDLGSVFNESFDLGTETISLAPFTLFNAATAGRTAGTAYRTEPTAVNNIATATVDAAGQVPVFLAADQLDELNSDTAYTVLEIEAISGGSIASVEVLDDRLTVSGGTAGTPFRISGYTASILEEQATALFAVRFDSTVSGAVVQVTRSAPISLSANSPTIGSNSRLVTGEDFERLGSRAVLSNDIDGDGLSLPETDGILLIRHLAGFSGSALTDNALGADATRTDPVAVADYIRNLLDQSLPPAQYGTTISTLDFDGDGGSATALGDGVLLARYLDGRRGAALTSGIVRAGAERQTGDEIVRFIEVGRASASEPTIADFDQVADRNGVDVFGLAGKRDADPNAVAGSSATAAQSGTQSSGGSGDGYGDGSGDSNNPAWTFELTSWGQSVDYEELYLDTIDPANLMSRIAVGSPTDFGKSQQKSLIDAGGASVNLQRQVVPSTLGTDEPLFIKAPDAGAYEYSASTGFMFSGFTVDPQIRGNLYQSAEFDLYLFDTASSEWVFDRLVTAADPSQVLPNGDLQVTFGGAGVSAFRLYSLALPNQELHGVDNTDRPDFEINTGVTLTAAAGVNGVPTVTMTQLVERLPFGEPSVSHLADPVFASDPSAVQSLFTVSRNLQFETVTSTTTGQGVADAPISALVGSSAGIELRGHDNVSDSALLDLNGGPLRVPIAFRGGFRQDVLLVSGADGVVDLIERTGATTAGNLDEAAAANVRLSEVEVVDLRGAGDIVLLVDSESVIANDPWHRQLFIRRDVTDSVPLDAAWTGDGSVIRNGVSYQRYVDGLASIYVESHSGGGDGFTNFAPGGGLSAGSTRFDGTTGLPKVPELQNLPGRKKVNSVNLFSRPESPDISNRAIRTDPDNSVPVPFRSDTSPAVVNRALTSWNSGHVLGIDSGVSGSGEVNMTALLDDVFVELGDLLLSRQGV